MSTPQQTDERLRHWLDTDQLSRERLCQAVLSLDKRFHDVRPRHPGGGPDGGRDLEAVFQDGRQAFGAVGFINSATDSQSEKTEAARKFRADLARALEAANDLKVFVFFTNVALTIGEKDSLLEHAKENGIDVVDVFDRERLRIALDAPEALGIRYEYLSLPLSEAEQAAFFAHWGNGLENLITESMRGVDSRLGRLEFFQEQTRPLSRLSFHFKLNPAMPRAEMLHFRAMMNITLPPMVPINRLCIGVCDGIGRLNDSRPSDASAVYGISWAEGPEKMPRILGETMSGRLEPLSQIVGMARGDPFFHEPILGKTVTDLDGSMVVFFANKPLADVIQQVLVCANY
jgi:hypothetical protein